MRPGRDLLHAAAMAALRRNQAGALPVPLARALADPWFLRFFQYWCTRAPERLLPGRQHIDPVELRAFLPGIVLYEIVREGARPRFRFRLCGTLVTELTGADLTGRFADEVHAEGRRDEIQRVLQTVVETAKPHFWETSGPIRGCELLTYGRLALPLAEDGITIDMILGLHRRVGPE